MRACVLHRTQADPGALAGFVLENPGPNSSSLPSGMLYPPSQLDWACSGLAVPDFLGVLLPSFLAFAGPVPAALRLSDMAVIELLDMQIVLQSCPVAWATAAQVIAQPYGASLKPQSGFQSQLTCDSIHGCTIDAALDGVHYQAGLLLDAAVHSCKHAAGLTSVLASRCCWSTRLCRVPSSKQCRGCSCRPAALFLLVCWGRPPSWGFWPR